jgi:hypothetical protein
MRGMSKDEFFDLLVALEPLKGFTVSSAERKMTAAPALARPPFSTRLVKRPADDFQITELLARPVEGVSNLKNPARPCL